MTTNPLRANLPLLPDRMKHLPVDARGYPVPRFVEWVDGVPDFRVMDSRYLQHCLRFRTCWLCGGTLGRVVAYVVGPMCAVNRVSAEPPSHRDCAEFAAMACPFLTMPKAKRREADLPEEAHDPAGIFFKRNPGVALVWLTKTDKPYRASAEGSRPGVLFNLGIPTAVAWFAQGRPATREEVLESLQGGIPQLEQLAAEEGPRGQVRLDLALKAAMQLVPAEAVAHG